MSEPGHHFGLKTPACEFENYCSFGNIQLDLFWKQLAGGGRAGTLRDPVSSRGVCSAKMTYSIGHGKRSVRHSIHSMHQRTYAIAQITWSMGNGTLATGHAVAREKNGRCM